MPEEEKKISIGDYDEIMADRKLFNKVVYTPLSEALRLLDERRKDPVLMAKVEKLLKGNIPEILKNKKCGVLARHIATPNTESRRFISITKENNLYPVFFEYHDDKFVPDNKYKHSLGQLHIQNKKDKNGNECMEKITIIDFNKYNGKKLKDVKTIWEELLIDFHKKLFDIYGFKKKDYHLYDASGWVKLNGENAIDFYVNYLLPFTCFGILFENFETSKDSEGDFTKNTLLPSLEKVINLVGVKPIIVPHEPLDLEIDDFWYHYLPIIKSIIPNK